VLLAEHRRVEDAAHRVERIHGRIDADLGERPREHRLGVEVAERGGGRRVGEVVGGHVDGLHRRDRALVRRGDALLELAHVGREGRLVADRRRDASEQCRHLGARLGETEDVVDEEQHVLALFVAEVLRAGERGEADARARTRRLVHLAIDERRLVEHRAAIGELRVRHLVPEVVALARALADASEHRVARVLLRDVVDELHQHDGLAHPGTAEEPHLAALGIRGQQIHDLDAGLEHLHRGRLVDELRRRPVDRIGSRRLDGAPLVHGLADHVHDAAQRRGPHRHTDLVAGVRGGLPAHQALGGVHGDAADGVLAQVLGDLDDEVALLVVDARVGEPQGGEDLRELARRELHVQHRPHHLYDPTGCSTHRCTPHCGGLRQKRAGRS
jgi:peptide chain release factor 1